MRSVSRDHIDLGIDALTRFQDIREWAMKVEETFELNSPSSTPATSRAAIGFRLVAEVLHRRLCERPSVTAMPANLSNSSGAIYQHPAYNSALRSLWGADASYGYETFLWHILPARPDELHQGRGLEWEAFAAGSGERAGSVGALEQAWNDRMQKIAVTVPPMWIAPQRGLALNASGEIVDLMDLYEENGRSVSRASVALFG